MANSRGANGSVQTVRDDPNRAGYLRTIRTARRAGEVAADYHPRIHQNPDAMAWARFFSETYPHAALGPNAASGIDGGSRSDVTEVMLGWFANAMMAMHDYLMGGGPINGDHAQYLMDHPERGARVVSDPQYVTTNQLRDLARASTPDHMTPNTIVVRYGGEFDLPGLLKALRHLGHIGSSRDVVVSDPSDEECHWNGFFDGDGCDRLDFDDPETARDRMWRLETAGASWWDQMTARERQAYVRAHPRSKYARAEIEAPRAALEQHLRASGFVRHGRAWTHPRSRRSVTVQPRGDKSLHLIVTHANGDVTEHPTDSLRRAKRVVRDAARPRPSRVGSLLRHGAGSLHAQMGVPRGRRIPMARLQRLATSDHPLATRARLVMNLQRTSNRALEWDHTT